MQFSKITGQDAIKQKLIQTVKNGRISHTQLFLGAEGVGALPLALAYAQYINCNQPTDDDSCGKCPSCIKFEKLIHPDLHFTFPTIAVEKKKLSNDFIEEWRSAFCENPYISELEWLLKLDSEGKKQGNITAEECRDIIRKLGLKAYEAKYKTVIIWLPEYLRLEGNILLKLLEEPPNNTLILMVAQDADKVIATILSRAQTLRIQNLTETDIENHLIKHFETDSLTAKGIARISEGSVTHAVSLLQAGYTDYFELFTTWMRLCYSHRRNINQLQSWIDTACSEGREYLKSFLTYCQHLMRAAFVYKFGAAELLRLSEQESQFVKNFSASLTAENIPLMVNLFNQSTHHLERNADLKITFLNLSLYIGQLLKKQKVA